MHTESPSDSPPDPPEWYVVEDRYAEPMRVLAGPFDSTSKARDTASTCTPPAEAVLSIWVVYAAQEDDRTVEWLDGVEKPEDLR